MIGSSGIKYEIQGKKELVVIRAWDFKDKSWDIPMFGTQDNEKDLAKQQNKINKVTKKEPPVRQAKTKESRSSRGHVFNNSV